MSAPQIFSEEDISNLTYRRTKYVHEMIRDIPPAKPSKITRKASIASLGELDLLPVELLLLILGFLDFQSLSRISRVSLRGKEIVEALPEYQDMMTHAPETLRALGMTRLLQCHSAPLLHQTLRSDKCVSCFEFGGFLFLPTCERVCVNCLFSNDALRMTTRAIAKQCFGLTDKHLERIPTMYSIPGIYTLWFRISRKRVYRLVSVKQAKQLAIEVHGSAENVAKLMPKDPVEPMTERQFSIFKQFHEASLEPGACDLSRLAGDDGVIRDDYCSMASIRFPYLTDAGAYDGRMCRGCFVTCEHYQRDWVPARVLSKLVPPGVEPDRVLTRAIYRLHSADGFLEHIKNCHGVPLVLAVREDDRRDPSEVQPQFIS